MAKSTGQFILERLADWGIKRIYGYPGDGINGLLGAFHEVGDRIEFTQTAHEEIAAFAATAHAKFTGEVGVCMGTSGPGAIHLLNGLYDARLDHQPVVAIVGQQKRMGLGSNYQQEVDLVSLYKDVAHEFVQVCMVPQQAPHLIDRAIRIAKSTRSVTAIIVPDDVAEMDYEEPPREHGAVYSQVGFPNPPRVVPREEDIRRAAEVLNAGERVAMLVGAGAFGAAREVKEVADILGCGVAKALNGKAALPDDLPFVTGSIGLLGTKPSNDMMENCDTLLMVGTGFPYSEWLPEPGQARGVQIDLDGRMVGIRYPTEVNLIGDAAETLRALIPHLKRKQDRSWREQIEANVRRWWEILEDRAHQSADPLNPQLVFHELSQRLPDRCILTADSGSGTNWWARHLKVREGMQAALSGTLATMCPAVPYALAAKFAYPDRPVIAAVGDGAMQMLGINALIDVGKYWERWSDPRLIVLVLNNRDLNQVTWEQRVLAGDPKLEASQVIPDFPFARYAEMLGFKGIRVDSPEAVAPAWEEALAADRPVVYEAVTDPEVPPLPPHIRFEQASGLARALAKGEPEALRIVKQSLKGKLTEFMNR
ncbi:Putative thiamine pyrophosphate-containing protein YdaP [Rubrobacter xylanophilus DSM 9941]|uniref:thiamine pyrophosphate-requiring protein n=1 Tax=Rubrobacter xylanophilus TaxID=49319 RepID=UPI001C63D65B|nr:thiamine pyrophosphate-requiring protein [Rubrobacter xylanophilus]QYJ15765.1 Putative thiamine pyrophosphate-containing protein YdaP [Rubrobacter xylanophilus DSM 9941]